MFKFIFIFKVNYAVYARMLSLYEYENILNMCMWIYDKHNWWFSLDIELPCMWYLDILIHYYCLYDFIIWFPSMNFQICAKILPYNSNNLIVQDVYSHQIAFKPLSLQSNPNVEISWIPTKLRSFWFFFFFFLMWCRKQFTI